VVVLLGCGLLEVAARRAARPAARPDRPVPAILPWAATPAVNTGGLGALAWVALKVGLLSYGGGFVIVPLMQADAVDRIHWMRGPY
jgi:chromate transporter